MRRQLVALEGRPGPRLTHDSPQARVGRGRAGTVRPRLDARITGRRESATEGETTEREETDREIKFCEQNREEGEGGPCARSTHTSSHARHAPRAWRGRAPVPGPAIEGPRHKGYSWNDGQDGGRPGRGSQASGRPPVQVQRMIFLQIRSDPRALKPGVSVTGAPGWHGKRKGRTCQRASGAEGFGR